jgi:zinc transport system substrate-binding protein
MKLLINFFCIVLFMLSCHPNSTEHPIEPHRLTVSILPQKYFVNRIAGNRWKVNVMIPPGHNPATYEPTALQMKSLAGSSIYFRIGHIPFELVWMKNLINLNPKMKVVDTSAGVRLIRDHHHAHHESGGHMLSGSKGVDPHIWLSPKLVKIVANHIYRSLKEIDPAHQSFYLDNYRRFLQEIDQLDREISQIMQAATGKKFLAYHPAWSYFARDYGLIQIPIESEGKNPRPADFRKVIDTARAEGIRFIIVQRQFDTHSAETIMKEINGRVIRLDPLDEDWTANLKKIANQFKSILLEKQDFNHHENQIR